MKKLLLLGFILSIISFTSCKDNGTGSNGSQDEPTNTYEVSVTISPDEAGTISPSAEGSYDEGEEVELTANPEDDYLFSHWTGDVDSTSNNPVTLTVDKDYDLEAIFVKKTYELTVNTEGEGSVTEEVVKSKDYEAGTVVKLTGEPAENYEFVEWSGDITGSENPTEITMDGPKEVTATFEQTTFSLTVNTNGEGTVTKTPDQETYQAGTAVELQADPAQGYEFTEWSGDYTGTENPVEVNVDSTMEITANFEEPTFKLEQNGVTISCIGAVAGESGEVNGTTYTKRNKDQITVDNAATTCTSGNVDMNFLFANEGTFNADISHWDVDSVKTMRAMFRGASQFNGDLSYWDVSNVEDMSLMFNNATSFEGNGDLSSWNVSSVTTMNRMFNGAEAFNSDLSNWDVSNVTNMHSLFRRNRVFTSDLSGWDVSNVTEMSQMFMGTKEFNSDIGSWDVSNVTAMVRMFAFSNFNQDLSGWCVSNFDSEPQQFADGAPLTEENKPVWGTCPSN